MYLILLSHMCRRIAGDSILGDNVGFRDFPNSYESLFYLHVGTFDNITRGDSITALSV